MREIFLTLAALISVFGLWNHIVRGRRLIVAPMLKTDLGMVPKHTLEFAWDWGAVTMAILAVGFAAPLWRLDFLPLAMLATVYAYALGAVSFWAMRRHGFRVSQMPQWIVFWAIAGFGLLGWGVF